MIDDCIPEYYNKKSSNILDDDNNNNLTENYKENLPIYTGLYCDSLFNDSYIQDSDYIFLNNLGNPDKDNSLYKGLNVPFNNYNDLKDLDPKNLSYDSMQDSSVISSEKSEFTKKKRKNEKMEEEKLSSEEIAHVNANKNQNFVENQKEKKKENKTLTKSTKKTGRRKKDEEYEEEAEHTKLSEDNIIRKIKTQIFNFIHENLNNSIKHYSGRFLPLTKKLNENLKKVPNLELLNMTIRDIYENTQLGKRYISKGNYHKLLIEKIFKENIETETINILSMKFIDVLKDIRDNNLENFLEKIRTKIVNNEKKKDNESENDNEECIDDDCHLEDYMKEIKRLLFDYEKWFTDKKGRNTKNNNKNN